MRFPRTRLVAALAVALAATAVFAAVGMGATHKHRAFTGVRGNFSLVMMVHTLDQPKTTPWNGKLRNGAAYNYRSIACNGNAPVNNIASDLPSYNGRVAGSAEPQSMRGQPFRFQTIKNRRDGWWLKGTIVMTVCKMGAGPTPTPDPVPDESKPKIYVQFQVKPHYVASHGEDLPWSGTFRLLGGTERYRDLRGSGTIAGYFLCFAGCSNFHYYHDAQFVMQGTYSDPTPELGASS